MFEKITKNFTRLQIIFLVAGTIILIVFLVSAQANLQEIYKEDPALFLGVLGSLSIWFFAKGFTKSIDDQVASRSIELMRNKGNAQLDTYLLEYYKAKLQDDKIYDNVALLEGNANSAYKRLSEYYDGQTGNPQFYKWHGLMRVIVDDLDKVSYNILQIRKAFEPEEYEEKEAEFRQYEQELESIKRDIGEAIHRRNETYEVLIKNKNVTQEFMYIFDVMTSDMFKAYKVFDEILSRSHAKRKLGLYLNDIRNYLNAADVRARIDLTKAVLEIVKKNPDLKKEGFLPRIHDIMIQDLGNARESLNDLQKEIEAENHKEMKNGEKT